MLGESMPEAFDDVPPGVGGIGEQRGLIAKGLC